MNTVVAWIARAVIVFLFVPIIAVVVYSFNSGDVTYAFTGVSLRWYQAVIDDAQLLQSLRTSLIVGLSSAAISTVIGFMSAYALTRFRMKGRGFFLGVVLIPMIVPEIVLGVALLTIFSTAHVPLGFLTLILGHAVITMPIATLVQIGAMASLDPSLTEAARDLGASTAGVVARVLVPLLRPAIGAAFLLAFVTSFSDIVVSTFTSGVGTTSLPLLIYSSLRTGLTPELNALGALLILTTVIALAVVGLTQLRKVLIGGPRTGP